MTNQSCIANVTDRWCPQFIPSFIQPREEGNRITPGYPCILFYPKIRSNYRPTVISLKLLQHRTRHVYGMYDTIVETTDVPTDVPTDVVPSTVCIALHTGHRIFI